jgi:hypothetical protein
MADFGVKVSKNGVDSTVAQGTDVVLTTKYPIAKLDKTNKASFQNIYLNITRNTPLGTTLIYQFKHGYSYIPSTWTMFNISGISASLPPYGQEYSILLYQAPYVGAELYVEVDATYVSYYINRLYNNYPVSGVGVDVSGIGIRVRTYVFVEDVNM